MKRRHLKRLVGERIVVHTRDSRSIRGVLTAIVGGWVVLSSPEYLDEAQPTGMPGEVWIAADNRSWIHRLG